jgi:hypothetical protein
VATALFTFDTTHHALWAEQIAVERRLAAQVVPAPADADAKCDLALEVEADDAAALAAALDAAGVLFRSYVSGAG